MELKGTTAWSGRLATDALGVLGQTETQLQAGAGVETVSGRWGEYTSMVVDPSDDCTLWYTTEYLASNGTFNWHTAINHIKFPSCQ